MRFSALCRTSLLSVLAVCAVTCVILSLEWPLVGDASLMHYVVFLMSKGFLPYRDIVDVNLPGSYLSEAAAMSIFGWGSVGWRVYDLTLMLILFVAAVEISRRRDWKAGLLAGALFALIHLQDGLAQAGQRDLLIAVLLVCAYAALFAAQGGSRRSLWIFLFGLLVGVTVTIKPLFLPLALVLLAVSAWSLRGSRFVAARHIACGVLGISVPGGASIIWLRSHGVIAPFFSTLTALIPFHASLGHKTLLYLLVHCASPVVPFFAIGLAVALCRRKRPTLDQVELMIGAAMALISYLMQGKGYPYQRYPFLALLLVLISMECAGSWGESGAARTLALAGLAYSCLVIAPLAVGRVRSFRTQEPFEEALAGDLAKLGGRSLDGKVQCLDTFGGCINTLYDMRIVQSTGFLYDCYLFLPGSSPVVDVYRSRFWAAYEESRPRILVMTNQYCFGANSFDKLNEWPLLRNEISRSYIQAINWRSTRLQRWWSRAEEPPEYRVYIRK